MLLLRALRVDVRAAVDQLLHKNEVHVVAPERVKARDVEGGYPCPAARVHVRAGVDQRLEN